jgi:hypothetical protein
MNKKLGIIIPYRHRYNQLILFKSKIIPYLKSKNIDFNIIVIDQDDAKNFNRGKLLNIGFIEAKKLKCDYVVFHDVDMLPFEVDYSYCEYPLHLATNFIADGEFNRIIFDEYFGGVTLFPCDVFETINGFSNEYWGWGYEDTDLLDRCKRFNIPLFSKEIKMMGGNVASLKFNGHNAFVKGKNFFDGKNDITIFLSFYPDEITCQLEKYDDTFSALTIPGTDLSINYNSYSRYNFEMYDSRKNVIYVSSQIKTNYKTNICVTISPINNTVKMYQDGIFVGESIYNGKLFDYEKIENFYLGVGDPERLDNPKYFKGTIDSFAVYSKILEENQIKEISENKFFGLTQDFGEYKSPGFLKVYYDAKFIKNYKLIDLSGNDNDGEISNCEIVGYTYEESKRILVPNRRENTFELMKHEENGYVKGAWKDITTRYNQLRFHNEVAKGYRNPKDDGLSNCTYKELSRSEVDNQTHILVSI